MTIIVRKKKTPLFCRFSSCNGWQLKVLAVRLKVTFLMLFLVIFVSKHLLWKQKAFIANLVETFFRKQAKTLIRRYKSDISIKFKGKQIANCSCGSEFTFCISPPRNKAFFSHFSKRHFSFFFFYIVLVSKDNNIHVIAKNDTGILGRTRQNS